MTASWGTLAAAAAPERRLARARRSAAAAKAWACAPALGLVLALVVIPVGWLFFLSFRDADGFTLRHYARMIANPGYALSLETTLWTAAVVTVVTTLLAYPVAYLIAARDGRRAMALLIVVLVPLWTALLVRTFAWMVLLQRTGPINAALRNLGLINEPLDLTNNLTGTVIAMTHIMVPLMVLSLLSGMRAVDRRLLWAAKSLGASDFRAFRDVFFPLSAPGLAAGAVLIFVLSLGYYVIPAFLGGGHVLMWSVKIVSNINVYADWGAASALGVVLLAIIVAILWACRALLRVLVRQAS
jgi:putative spermidine/putrescine transport system permease protein